MALKIIKRLNNTPSLHGPGIVMKASLIASFFFHIILLLSFQNVFPLHLMGEKLRMYRVELIRPPVEDIDAGDIPGNHIDHLNQKELPPPEKAEDTISLDTKDKRYISYARLIKKEIMRHWRYPPEARAYLIEGSLMALFSLARDGRMLRISIIKSSGHAILDEEVTRAINSSVPFPPFPGSITVKRLNIKAAFDYRLTSGKRSS
ncbi:energy transducer TonB [Thermodesulfobacteriota bacterium]